MKLADHQQMDVVYPSQPFIQGTTVGEVLDANSEALKAFIQKFKKNYRKEWLVRSISA
jgi:hypothetical protein